MGLVDNLIVRMVDVMLKERKLFVLFFCEMFLNMIYLENMLDFLKMGVIFVLFMLVFYNKFKMIDDIVIYIVV